MIPKQEACMTPKEKAQEIFNLMQEVYNMEQYPDFTIEFDDNKKNDELWETNRDLFNNIYNEFAKRCSLIAVNEVIEQRPHVIYWYKVKEEIQKL